MLDDALAVFYALIIVYVVKSLIIWGLLINFNYLTINYLCCIKFCQFAQK